MQINSINTNFSGRLYLNNPKLWTDGMKKAIQGNDSIAQKLQNHDIYGNISTKIEKKTPPIGARHRMGDTLYKVNFVVAQEDQGLIGRIKNKFLGTGSTYDVNRHFHSEFTTIDRLKYFKF